MIVLRLIELWILPGVPARSDSVVAHAGEEQRHQAAGHAGQRGRRQQDGERGRARLGVRSARRVPCRVACGPVAWGWTCQLLESLTLSHLSLLNPASLLEIDD